MKRVCVIGVALLALTSCAAPSTTLQNDEGKSYSCSSWGVGLIGTTVALASEADCENRMKAAGYHESSAPVDATQTSPAKADQARSSQSSLPQTITSKDGRLQFVLPAGWKVSDPPPELTARANVLIYALNPTLDGGLTLTSIDKRDITDLKQYVEGIKALQIEMISNGVGSDIQETTINGYPAARVDVRGTTKGINVHYLITAIETRTEVPKLNAVTSESKFADSRPALEALAANVSERTQAATSK